MQAVLADVLLLVLPQPRGHDGRAAQVTEQALRRAARPRAAPI